MKHIRMVIDDIINDRITIFRHKLSYWFILLFLILMKYSLNEVLVADICIIIFISTLIEEVNNLKNSISVRLGSNALKCSNNSEDKG